MFAVAQGLSWFATPLGQGVAHGLKLAAVAVVAQAVCGMAQNLCRTWLRALIAIAVCIAIALIATPWVTPLLIAAGGLIGLLFVRAPAPPTDGLNQHTDWRTPALCIALFSALLFGLPLIAGQAPVLAVADAFYRAGALVFGGGHVVLPLLDAETVRKGWLAQDQFLAGYGAAQAMPGPLFSFAAFVGAASHKGDPALMSLIALVFIFLPGVLLVSAGLPLWEALKHRPRALGFVAGANAAVVGVLAAALYKPIFVTAVTGWLDLALALAGFAALQLWKAPSWLVVLLLGAAGAALPFLGGIGL
jgi:chromate transporter